MNKRGWIRILEVSISILIVAGVMLTIASKQKQREDLTDYVYEIQRGILQEISNTESLRNAVLTEDIATINTFVAQELPANLEFLVKICELDVPCKMTEVINKDIYVESAVISSSLETYAPKQIMFYTWEK